MISVSLTALWNKLQRKLLLTLVRCLRTSATNSPRICLPTTVSEFYSKYIKTQSALAWLSLQEKQFQQWICNAIGSAKRSKHSCAVQYIIPRIIHRKHLTIFKTKLYCSCGSKSIDVKNAIFAAYYRFTLWGLIIYSCVYILLGPIFCKYLL